MKKMNKRILAMLLAIVTIVSLFPLTVFADETGDDVTPPEHVTITVNYVYSVNNAMVAAPWSAQLDYNGDLQEVSVPVPAAEGYSIPADKVVISAEDTGLVATIGKDADNKVTSLKVSAKNLQQDVSVTLFYDGEDVKYIINHLQQNLENNEYTKIDKDTVEITGTIDYIPEIKENTYEGFYFANRNDQVIDGVTHINFLYDRERHLVTFDTNKGVNGPDPMYVKYGTSIDFADLVEPTRGTLYEFGGWYIGNDRYYSVEQVTGPLTFTAKWSSKDNEAPVTYIMWGKNADGTDYDYIGKLSGEEYKGTVGNEITFATLNCGLVEHLHDSNCDICGNADGHTHRLSCYSCFEHSEGEHKPECYDWTTSVTQPGSSEVIQLTNLEEYTGNHNDYLGLFLKCYSFGLWEKPGTYGDFIVKKDTSANIYYLWNKNGDDPYSCLAYFDSPDHEYYSAIMRVSFPEPSSDNSYDEFLNGVSATTVCSDQHTHTQTCFEYRCSLKDATYNGTKVSLVVDGSYYYPISKDYFRRLDEADKDYAAFLDYLSKTNLIPGTYYKVYDIGYVCDSTMYVYENGEVWGAIGSSYGGDDSFLIRLDGVWYQTDYSSKSEANLAKGKSNLKDCVRPNHVHGDGNCSYGCGEHEHTSDCYDHGEHAHTKDCFVDVKYQYDENLWRLISSTTEEVEADGTTIINAYFDRTIKTIKFHWDPTATGDIDGKYSYTEWAYTDSITAPWGTNIGEQWLAINNHAQRTYWQSNPQCSGNATAYLELMPQEDQNYYCDTGSLGSNTATYHVQKLDSEEFEQIFSITSFGSSITREDIYPMQGFEFDCLKVNGSNNSRVTYTAEDIKNSEDNTFGNVDGAEFYYKRKTNNLIYHSLASEEYSTASVLFGTSLANYDIVPEASDAVKALYGNNPVFLGWYQNAECTGEPFNFAARTMPDAEVALFAKWVAGVYNVRTYIDDTCQTLYTYDGYSGEQLRIPVYEYAVKPNDPEKENEIFVGWVYKDNDGVEHFFSFDMPITKNYDLYPKFSTNVAVDYVVHFYLAGTTTKVAEDITGTQQIGSVVKATAKLGDQLTGIDAADRAKYFPDKISVSETLTHDGMEIIFYYSKPENLQYTVNYVYKYIDAEGNEVVENLFEPVTETTTSSIVTETYKPKDGYSPKLYKIQLTLSANPDENIITFEYDKVTKINYAVVGDPVNTVTPVEETVLNDDPAKGATATPAENYRLVGWYDNEACTGEPLSTELTFAPKKDTEGKYAETYYAKFVQTTTVTVYHAYYTNSIQSVLATETFTADVGGGFKPQYISIEGYAPMDIGWGIGGYSDGSLSESEIKDINFIWDHVIHNLNDISVPENGLTIGLYYRLGEEDVTISYEQLKDGETTDLGSETIKESSGTPAGKTAVAIDGYEFLGWYDEAGNQVETKAAFVPAKTGDKYVAATYYAKYDKLVTINYKVVGNGTLSVTNETIGETTGVPTGSAPTVPEGYHFVGWFIDKGCETSVDSALIGENNKLTPQQVDGKYVPATYYAKFAPNTLTITKNGGSADEQYILSVLKSDGSVLTKVVVAGNGGTKTITNIPVGEYTIVEDTNWSWRYSKVSTKVKVEEGSNAAAITNGTRNNQWLSGVDFARNIFAKKN